MLIGSVTVSVPAPSSVAVASYIRNRLIDRQSEYFGNVTYCTRVLFYAYAIGLTYGFRICDESPRWTEHGFTFINVVESFNDSFVASGYLPSLRLETFAPQNREAIEFAVERAFEVVGTNDTKTLIAYQKTIEFWTVENNRRIVTESKNQVFQPRTLPDANLFAWCRNNRIGLFDTDDKS